MNRLKLLLLTVASTVLSPIWGYAYTLPLCTDSLLSSEKLEVHLPSIVEPYSDTDKWINPAVLYIGGNGDIDDDQQIINNIEAWGYEVTFEQVTQSGQFTVDDIGETDIIYISSSVSSGDIGNTLLEADIPIILGEHLLFDDMKLTSGSDLGSSFASDIQILDDEHPIVNGFEIGIVNVFGSESKSLGWGKPSVCADRIASLSDNNEHLSIFSYDPGDVLVDGSLVVNKRIGFFARAQEQESFSEEIYILLRQAFAYALSEEIYDTGGCDDQQSDPFYCEGGLGAASSYNLMVLGNATQIGGSSGGAVQGKVAVGGNLSDLNANIGQDFESGNNLEDDATSRTLVVGADIGNSQNAQIGHGRFSFTGGFSGSITVFDPEAHNEELYLADLDLGLVDKYRQTPPFDFAYVRFQMSEFSQSLVSLDAESFSSAIEGNAELEGSTLVFDGQEEDKEIYLFLLEGTEFSGADKVELAEIGAHATLVINIAGSVFDLENIDFGAMETFAGQVIFNFYEAQSLRVGNFYGTILAPQAALNASNFSMQGQLIVNTVSVLDDFTLYNVPFRRCISPVVAQGIDYGDAPASYGQAWHIYNGNSSLISYLGTSVDYESSGFETNDAGGDDFDNLDDENGIEFIGGALASPGESKTLEITVFSNFQDVFVNIWVDFNQDGVFDPEEERVVENEEFDQNLHDPVNFVYNRSVQFTVPEDAKCGDTYLRVRLESDPTTIPTGQEYKGEVEDYVFTVICIQGGEYDFGDAPSTYGISSHKVNGVTSLGDIVDSEEGNQGTIFANGDDQNGEDDEDGVVFGNGPIITQENGSFQDKLYTVTINNESDKTFYLSAWIDTDADGAFDSQFIFDQAFGIGTNQSFNGPSITIPDNEELCGEVVIVRFRLSDVPGVGASGGEVEGEVEDYALIVSCEEEFYIEQGILPVDWLSVSTKEENDGVRVSWVTASEINNSYFEVQRSSDSVHFQTIGTQEGAGNSNEIQYYSLVDKQTISGTQYYRIKQVDFDGSYDYSNIVSISISSQHTMRIIRAYPSPTDGKFWIKAKSTNLGEASLNIYTLSGKLVFDVQTPIVIGTYSYPFDVSDLPSGIYIIHWSQEGYIHTQRLLKH